jgi:hypothetical protein
MSSRSQQEERIRQLESDLYMARHTVLQMLDERLTDVLYHPGEFESPWSEVSATIGSLATSLNKFD